MLFVSYIVISFIGIASELPMPDRCIGDDSPTTTKKSQTNQQPSSFFLPPVSPPPPPSPSVRTAIRAAIRRSDILLHSIPNSPILVSSNQLFWSSVSGGRLALPSGGGGGDNDVTSDERTCPSSVVRSKTFEPGPNRARTLDCSTRTPTIDKKCMFLLNFGHFSMYCYNLEIPDYTDLVYEASDISFLICHPWDCIFFFHITYPWHTTTKYCTRVSPPYVRFLLFHLKLLRTSDSPG